MLLLLQITVYDTIVAKHIVAIRIGPDAAGR